MQLTVREAAALLGVPEKTLYRWIDRKEIPVQEVQGQVRLNRAELLEWATARRIRISPETFAQPDENGGSLPALSVALEAGGVFHGVAGADKQAALRAMVDLLRLPPEVDREFLLQVLLARETLGSTGIGDGIAIPHVRNPLVLQVPAPAISLCYLERPIDFGAVDGKPVAALFTLISPTTKVHLHLLTRLGAALHDPGVKGAVLRQARADELLREVKRVEAALPARRG